MEYLEENAIKLAKNLSLSKVKADREASKSLMRKAIDYGLKFEIVKNKIFGKAQEDVQKLTKGFYPAPLRILEVSFAAVNTEVNCLLKNI